MGQALLVELKRGRGGQNSEQHKRSVTEGAQDTAGAKTGMGSLAQVWESQKAS